MLAWMQDPRVLTFLRMEPEDATLERVNRFIEAGADLEKNAHFAVVDEDDTYLGTVSLKHIDAEAGKAEFAIALRPCAQGRGVGGFATRAALEYGFMQRKLSMIWLEVLSLHAKGVACYERAGFRFRYALAQPVTVHGKMDRMLHYEVTAEEYAAAYPGAAVLPCLEQVRRLTFQQQGDQRGRLVIAECGREVPFSIQRIFYIYGSEGNVTRGRHANRESEFVLINVAGTSKVRVTDGTTERVFSLDHPHEGLYLPKMIWKEMYDFSPDSVLLVLSNRRYDPKEYVRDYQTYLSEVRRLG